MKNKTALMQAIEEMGKYSWGHYDPISVLLPLLPTEQEQIETAHRQGNKIGYFAGGDAALGVGNKTTTAQKDASNYFKNTYND